VHVRNTRPFSATRPLDAPHLLDESVFPKGWEKKSFIGVSSSGEPKVVLLEWDAKRGVAKVRRRITGLVTTIPESEIDLEPGLREQVEKKKKAEEAKRRS
jgi:hypothetical protein